MHRRTMAGRGSLQWRRRRTKSRGTGARSGHLRPDDAAEGRLRGVRRTEKRRTHGTHTGHTAHRQIGNGLQNKGIAHRRRRLPDQTVQHRGTAGPDGKPGGTAPPFAPALRPEAVRRRCSQRLPKRSFDPARPGISCAVSPSRSSSTCPTKRSAWKTSPEKCSSAVCNFTAN